MNSNVVVLACHFYHRVELFFKEIWLIRVGSYYAVRVEFQFKGSSHIHSFLWMPNLPLLNEILINRYVDFSDSVVCGNLPSKQEESNLYLLIKTFQIHYYSKASHEYKNMKYRFKFGRFLLEKHEGLFLLTSYVVLGYAFE